MASKPRENRNGKGYPRNARSVKNLLKNEAYRDQKVKNGGLGAREFRRAANRETRSKSVDSPKIAEELD